MKSQIKYKKHKFNLYFSEKTFKVVLKDYDVFFEYGILLEVILPEFFEILDKIILEFKVAKLKNQI